MPSAARRPRRRSRNTDRFDDPVEAFGADDTAYYESHNFAIAAPPAPTGESPTAAACVGDYQPYDDLGEGQRWSSWDDLEALCRGPEPRPHWVVTSSGAIDTDLGILKTGKEADVYLVERCDPHLRDAVVMAAKRYRDAQHTNFRRSASYAEGRSVKRSRDQRALATNTSWGRTVASMEWANAEWNALRRAWQIGLPVPYPVQIDGTELMMEWISHEGQTAPRLAQTRPDEALLADYFAQLREAMAILTQDGWVHGDLSPYNILAAGPRLVIIDLPQILSLTGHDRGFEYLRRDCTNVCRWFTARGLAADPDELYDDLLGHAF